MALDILTPTCIFLYISSALTLIAAIRAFQQSNYPIATWCGFLMLGFSLYSFGYAHEITSKSIEYSYFWVSVQFVSVAYLPAFIILMVISYQRTNFPPLIFIFSLLLLSSITVILTFSNHYHHWLFSIEKIDKFHNLSISDLTVGPWYFLHLVYINSAWLVAFIILLKHYISDVLYRKQIAMIMLGNTIPWVCYLLNIIEITPIKIDLSPFASFFMGAAYCLGLFKYRFTNITPIARDKLFETLSDSVVVLNEKFDIVDFNKKFTDCFSDISNIRIGEHISKLRFIPDDFKKINFMDLDTWLNQFIINNKYFEIKYHPLRYKNISIIGYILTICEITERINNYQKLKHHAEIDPLTKTYNRRVTVEKLTEHLNNPSLSPLSIILFDIDFFKSINDNLGHSGGDKALMDLSNLICENILPNDSIGRYGGDEFIILAPNTTSSSAFLLAEKLNTLCKNKLSISLSMGISTANEFDTPDSLINKADIALYKAKSMGRSQAVILNESVDLH